MEKTWIRGLSALALALPATTMAQGLPDSSYGAAGLALQMPDYADDDGVALNLRAGADLSDLGANLDLGGGSLWVEGELTQTLVKPSYDFTVVDPVTGATDTTEYDVSVTTLGAYARYVYPVDPITLEGRLGLSYLSADVDGGGSDSDLGLDFGVGVGFDLTHQIRGVVEYTILQSDVDHFGFTAQYAF
ncbi:MAG: outer membrane beta-barrel protein [Thiohalorhabdus sp.]|uniref:outer membrane beta-barrel protein n=1 Tax=Thiohalorhabdus sp. TaxID=3094134 RepID=UPI00397EBE86